MLNVTKAPFIGELSFAFSLPSQHFLLGAGTAVSSFLPARLQQPMPMEAKI